MSVGPNIGTIGTASRPGWLIPGGSSIVSSPTVVAPEAWQSEDTWEPRRQKVQYARKVRYAEVELFVPPPVGPPPSGAISAVLDLVPIITAYLDLVPINTVSFDAIPGASGSFDILP